MRPLDCQRRGMFQPGIAMRAGPPQYPAASLDHRLERFLGAQNRSQWFDGIQRRWQRARRRRKVARAYDMALEIARLLPASSRILDVGCGNGYITHHLSALLKADVVGIDLDVTAEAAIDYRQFDGKHFPLGDGSVDVVLLCYVLHHAQDLGLLMAELRRVLSSSGQAIIYEDIPLVWWDRLVCWIHNLKWRARTGPCTFRVACEWRASFDSAGFEIVTERSLSRWRNLTHSVSRRLYVLKRSDNQKQ